jgi:NAD(P)-dependent dehydrogenase (short-subunit alcohol dehydrogenase family)
MRGLQGKIVMITGGCGDLGGATVRRLADEGAHVVVTDILDEPTGSRRAQELGAKRYLRFSQTDRAGIEQCIASVVNEYGRLDIAIANAACVERSSFIDLTPEQWQKQIDINLTGYFNVTQLAARAMLRQAPDGQGVRGKILMTSSWVGQRPLPGATGYVVSKAGVDSLVQAVAQELSPMGIRVNAVAPGLVYSGLTRQVCDSNPVFHAQLLGMIPLNELGTSEQIASAYAFLCSDESNYMTGQTLVVDGGCSVIKRDPA